MTNIDHKRLARQLDRRRQRRRLMTALVLFAAAVAALMYLRCGTGWGTGGQGAGEGGRDPKAAVPRDAAARCALRLAATGLTLDGKPATREQAIVACQKTTGADVLITGDVRQGDWDELRSALEAAGIQFFTREPRGSVPGRSDALP